MRNTSADVIVGVNLGNGRELGSLLRKAHRFYGSLESGGGEAPSRASEDTP